MRVSSEVEVRDLATLIEVWLVNEMPSRLIAATFVLDFVSKSGAFNERMVFL